MTDALMKESLSDFTKAEFLSFVTAIFSGDYRNEEDDNRIVAHFDRLVFPHPQRNGLIFWPEDGKDSPEAVVAEIERYCRENGLPGFRDSSPQSVPARMAAFADKLHGQRFATFDDFREAFWKEVAADPALAGQFSRENQTRMVDGLAPRAPVSGHVGERRSFELDHVVALFRGGDVYRVPILRKLEVIEALRKSRLSDFTREEYSLFVDAIAEVKAKTEDEHGVWLKHWDTVNPHPEKNGLMYWPSDGKPRTTTEIVVQIERYCRENGLPGFKDSDF